MKTYQEQEYKTSIKVLVDFGDCECIDEIKGLNEGHALYLANKNWENAIITIIK